MLGMLRPPYQALHFSQGIFHGVPWRAEVRGAQACLAFWQDWLS